MILSRKFAFFCVKNKIWVTAAHILDAENVAAGYISRKS